MEQTNDYAIPGQEWQHDCVCREQERMIWKIWFTMGGSNVEPFLEFRARQTVFHAFPEPPGVTTIGPLFAGALSA